MSTVPQSSATGRRTDLGRHLTTAYLLAPAVLLLLVFFALPLVVVFAESFSDSDRPLGNYRDLWESILVRRAVRTSFELAVTTTLICLVVGYPVAYRLSLMPRARANLLLLVILFPVWTAVLARLYAWTILLGRRGPINDFLLYSGIVEQPVDLVFTRASALAGLVHITLPYMVLVLYLGMRGVDRALLDVSRSLGAGWPYTFRRILLPLTLPTVAAGSGLVFILAVGNFITPEVLGGRRDYTIPPEIFRLAQVERWGEALALSAILLAAVLAALLGLARVVRLSGLSAGGTRG